MAFSSKILQQWSKKFLAGFSTNSKNIKADIIAGLSVTALVLPQTMAFALIAGLPPIYGLYSAIVAMIAGAILGASHHLIVGPTNVMALALANILAGVSSADYLQAVLLFTFMVGFFQLVLTFFKLGELVNYISRSVINGLTTGVALLIISGQLGNFFGFEHPSGINIIMELYHFMMNLSEVNPYAIFIALLCLVTIVLIKKFYPQLPEYLLGMLVCIAAVYFFDWQDRLAVAGVFPPGLPGFNPFAFDTGFIFNYWSAALSTAMLGFIYTLSTVKALEVQTGQELDFNRVFLAQGLINIICSFFSSFIAAGSLTKSFANLQAGAKSKLAELIAALAIIPVLIFFRPLGQYIPIPALGSLVIVVAAGMIDLKELRDCIQNKFDALIFGTTFLTTILAPRLDYAIYFGVIVSLILVLKNTSSINYSHFDYQQRDSEFFSRDIEDVKEDEYIVINLAGNINFNAASSLKEKLGESYRPQQKFIIRMRDVENIDLTSLKELEKFIDKVQKHEGAVFFCGLDENIIKLFEKYGLKEKIGQQNIFLSEDHIFSATKSAIKKAREITLPYDVNNESLSNDDEENPKAAGDK